MEHINFSFSKTKQSNRKHPSLLCFSVLGFLFVSIWGTLAHFFFEWSGENFIVGLFTPVNESIWEHMKLLFFPMLLLYPFCNYYLTESKENTDFFSANVWGKKYPAANCAFAAGLLGGTLFIPIVYYTYSGMIGFHIVWFDILIFYLAVLFAFFLFFRLARHSVLVNYEVPLLLFVLVFFMLFLIFSYLPTNLPLFYEV